MIVDSVLEISRSQNSYRIFWEIVCVFFIQKQFLTRGNLSCWQIKVICLTFWYENLTTFPTSDSKLEITFPIAHSLSYNILNLGRKWSYNNRDTAQRSLPCRFMFGKKCPPIDITRKYEKLCIFAFNRKFDYDDVIKMKINVICIVENCLSYNI